MQVILKGGGVEEEEGGCTTRHGGAGGPALLALFRRLDLETNLVRSLAPSPRLLPSPPPRDGLDTPAQDPRRVLRLRGRTVLQAPLLKLPRPEGQRFGRGF